MRAVRLLSLTSLILLALLGCDSSTPPALPTPVATSTLTPPTATIATPTKAIAGQVVEYTGIFGRGRLRGTVTEVIEAGTIGDATAKGKFVLVFLDVTNIGEVSAEIGAGLQLQDSQGRVFNAADITPQFQASEQYKVRKTVDELQPGLSDKVVIVFDVAIDATGYLLKPIGL